MKVIISPYHLTRSVSVSRQNSASRAMDSLKKSDFVAFRSNPELAMTDLWDCMKTIVSFPQSHRTEEDYHQPVALSVSLLFDISRLSADLQELLASSERQPHVLFRLAIASNDVPPIYEQLDISAPKGSEQNPIVIEGTILTPAYQVPKGQPLFKEQRGRLGSLYELSLPLETMPEWLERFGKKPKQRLPVTVTFFNGSTTFLGGFDLSEKDIASR